MKMRRFGTKKILVHCEGIETILNKQLHQSTLI